MINKLGYASLVTLPIALAMLSEPAKAQSNIQCFNPLYNAWQPCSISNPLRTGMSQQTPLGCLVISGLSSAVGFSGVPVSATVAYIQVSGANVNWRDDGVNPTASSGMTLIAGQAPFQYNGNLSAIKFIQTAAGASGFACFEQ